MNNSTSSHDLTVGNDIRANAYGLLFVVITFSLVAACLAVMGLTYLLRRLGFLPSRDAAASEQVRQDWLMAMRYQQHQNQQHQHGAPASDEDDVRRELQRMMEKRTERREWYQNYLKPFTMVAKESDFVMSSNDSMSNMKEDSAVADGGIDEEMPKLSSSCSLETSTRQCGLRLRQTVTSTTSPSIHSSNGQMDQGVVIAASCAICLGDYEVGDRIIWASEPECRHAFHDDCILTWLSKGKKRCPICRNWFVPMTYFDDLKEQQRQQQLQQQRDQQAVGPSVVTTLPNEGEEDIEEGGQEDGRRNDDENVEDNDTDEALYLSVRRTLHSVEASSAGQN